MPTAKGLLSNLHAFVSVGSFDGGRACDVGSVGEVLELEERYTKHGEGRLD